MDPAMQRRFLAEIETQCSFALRGSRELGPALDRHDTEGVWYALQAILVSAANISKLLWGSPKSAEDEKRIEATRRDLRHSIRVNKKSPLYRRAVRNAFEHFDATLETLQPRIFVSRNIGPPDMIAGAKAPRFGHFDPQSGLVTFWRESVNIDRIVDEVARIHPLAQAEIYKKL